MTDLRARAARVLELEAQAILALVPRLDGSFDTAVGLLERCGGRVIVTGMGKSGIIARKIAATLASTGTPAHFLHPGEGMHGDLGMVARGDVVVVLSNSGETDEILALVPRLKHLGVPIVLLTGRVGSALAGQCDVVLDVSVRAEACPLGLAPTASTTAALAMGDALTMALLEARGLGADGYAALHPRGALGWRTSVRVADLMHSGAAVPVVAAAAALKDVIAEMTQKGLGMTTVVDAAGRLAGVITDGDLRRLHLREGPIGEYAACDFMSGRPRLIEPDAQAATALEVMETSGPVTSLVIVDAESRPVGVIHLHDILRAKIDF